MTIGKVKKPLNKGNKREKRVSQSSSQTHHKKNKFVMKRFDHWSYPVHHKLEMPDLICDAILQYT